MRIKVELTDKEKERIRKFANRKKWQLPKAYRHLLITGLEKVEREAIGYSEPQKGIHPAPGGD